MADKEYIPFSEVQSQPDQISTITTIEEYKPANAQAITHCNPVLTHCYVCGRGWGYGHWKHCGCNTVPIGNGTIILLGLAIMFSIYKIFKSIKYVKKKSNTN